MSAIATALKHMLAAGMPHDAIVAAVAEMEAGMSVDEVAERRRAYDRERKAKAKAARSGGIPVDSAESVETAEQDPLSPSPLPSPQTPQTTPHPHTPVKQTPRARGKHPMPADWEPSPLTGDTAQAVAGWPPGSVERELARFRDWAAGGGPNTRKENWDATWRNWLRRAQDEGRYRERPTGNRGDGGSRTAGAVAAVMERLGDRATTGAALADRRSDRPAPSLPSPVRASWHESGGAG